MANVIITLKIMPSDPEVNLEYLQEQATAHITTFGGEVGRATQEPVAFGIKALNIIFVMDEKKGSTEILEKQITSLTGVASAEVTDVRRAVG